MSKYKDSSRHPEKQHAGKEQKTVENKWKEFSEDEPEDQDDLEAQPRPEGIEFPARNELENQLTRVELERDDYKNQMLRMKAEVENIRRRSERNISNAHKFGNEKLIEGLLHVEDSLVRGLQGGEPADETAKTIYDGLSLTLEMFEKVLNQHGVTVINPKQGEAFDPQLHEAITMQESPDAKSNTVVQVLQRGFELHGRLLRAAKVIVAK